MKEPNKVADIIGTLVVLNRGNFVIEAGREFTELTEAITQTNKKGTITIKLAVVPSGWTEDGHCNQVDVQPAITLSKPKKEQGKSIFFVTEDNQLTREDPAQNELFAEEKETKNVTK